MQVLNTKERWFVSIFRDSSETFLMRKLIIFTCTERVKQNWKDNNRQNEGQSIFLQGLVIN
nr:hypothetical protein BCU99_13650 [Vibrio cyclitrophicus]